MIKDLNTSEPVLAAAIDIGSNAMRLRICGLDGHHNLETVHYHREAVRLGKDAFTTGYLSEAIMSDTEHAFDTFHDIISRYHVKHVRAVATSALRDAKNAQHLVKRVHQKTGIAIEIISGDEEGQLIHSAIHKKIEDSSQGTALLIDIGGGSVEITITTKGEIISIESYKSGTVRLIERFREKDGGYNLKLLKSRIAALQRKIKSQIGNKTIDLCIGTGGNIEALGELGVSQLDSTSSDILNYEQLKQLCEKISALSYEERTKQLQLRPDRADVIMPASLILNAVMELAQPALLKIPKVGLTDGILLQLLSQKNKPSPSREHQAITWANTLSMKFLVNIRHAEYVSKLSQRLMEECSAFATFHPNDGLLLHMAALLHEVGKFIRGGGHHRHAHYIISALPIIGLTVDEKNLVASIVRYHRKRIPEATHSPFCLHSEEDQQRLLKLTTILRIAIALNKERKYNIEAISCQHTNTNVEIHVSGYGSHTLGIWTAKKQRPWFAAAFQKDLLISDQHKAS